MTIDIVIGDFNAGASPEEIARRYPPLPVSDIYGVIWYYLRHKEDIDQYLTEREREAEEAERRIESQRSPEQLQLIERIRAARKSRSTE